MLLLGELAYYFGYFLFMIIFMLVAISKAKSKRAWIWYAIGAFVQLIPMYGNQVEANMNGVDETLDWIVYFGLLIITAIVVNARYKKTIASNNEKQDELPINQEKPVNDELGEKTDTSVDSQDLLFCHKCGAQLLPDSVFCDKCGAKVVAPIDSTPAGKQIANDINTTFSAPTVNQISHNIPSSVEKKNSNKAWAVVIITLVSLLAIALAALLVVKIVEYNNEYSGDGIETTDGGKTYYLDTDGFLKEKKKSVAIVGYDGKIYAYYEEFDKYLRQDENAVNVYYDENEKSYYIVYNYTTGTRRLEEYDTDSEEWSKENNSKSAS